MSSRREKDSQVNLKLYNAFVLQAVVVDCDYRLPNKSSKLNDKIYLSIWHHQRRYKYRCRIHDIIRRFLKSIM